MIFKKRSIGALLTVGLTLAGCETPPPHAGLDSKASSSFTSKREINPAVLQAFQLLKEEKISEASKFINTALQTQPKSVILHLLNALTYEKMAVSGDANGSELAAVGYQNALNLDPSNLFAVTQLGKLKYREQHYDLAQEHFANALLLKPNDANLLQEFAAASYYAYDLKGAYAAIQKAEKLNPDDPLIHRSAAMICAALGDLEGAQKHLAFFQSKVGKDTQVDHVRNRLEDWASLYNSKKVTLAAASAPAPAPEEGGGGGGDSGGTAPDPSQSDEAKDVLAKPFSTGGSVPKEEGSNPDGPQIILDCYLLQIVDSTETAKGNNILNSLAVTLSPGTLMTYKGSLWGSGAPATGTTTSVTADSGSGFNVNPPGLLFGTSVPAPTGVWNPSTIAQTLSSKGSLTGRIFAAGLSWAGLTYSLNIANAFENRSEILSRPSLITFLNKPSTFFSGQELVAGLAGQYGGNLVKYPIGTSIVVTPQSLEGDMLTINIGIENSNGAAANEGANLQSATINVNTTRIDTTARMRLGETLMLGGIYVRQDFYYKNKVPGLGDVPILQYFFANELTGNSRTSIVFMLTPRSPDAVKSAVNRAMSRETFLPHYNELLSRHPDWFTPGPNAVSMFRYLSLDPSIYYEFRTGDVLPPSFAWDSPFGDKLSELQAFLYF